MKINLTVTLSDERHIGYAEYGDPEGYPVFYFHGLPGSRYEAAKLHESAVKNHCKLFGIDRPGMGLSSIHKNRTLLTWADDIEAFANALQLSTFSLIGHSGGAPYVAACAYKIPHRIKKAVIVAGMAPFNYPEAMSSLSRQQKMLIWIIRNLPFMFTMMMKMNKRALNKPQKLKKMLEQLPEVDKSLFDDERQMQLMIDALTEAFKQGVEGVCQDFKSILNPWGFALEEISCPVMIWQGGVDQQAPKKHAEIYQKFIPNAELVFLEKEGHLSILKNDGDRILQSCGERG